MTTSLAKPFGYIESNNTRWALNLTELIDPRRLALTNKFRSLLGFLQLQLEVGLIGLENEFAESLEDEIAFLIIE